jgi:bacteriorhodopsin
MIENISDNIHNNNLVKSSFYTSYALLFTTGTITFIEALRTNDEKIRHIMNIETVISVIAGYFYSKFIKMFDTENVDLNKINLVRYTDWSLSTPFMLLGLGLVMSYNLDLKFKLKHFIIMLLFNFGMLLFGYLGEIKKIDRNFALWGGFAFFAFLYYYIYYLFVKDKKSVRNSVVYFIFLIVWAIYGIAYNIKSPLLKNLVYNTLDVVAKCMVGIGFWAYFAKIFD